VKRTTFDLPLSLERGGGEPLRTQVMRELRAAIQSGRLAAGHPLPSTRALAADLGVSRGVVVEAYEQLAAAGYLQPQAGSATRVALRLPSATPPSSQQRNPAAVLPAAIRYDFRPGVPDVSLFPRRAWLRALRRAWSEGPMAVLDYPDPAGAESARVALAAYLNRSRATNADPRRVAFCTGFAQAARLVGEALFARGVRRLAVENPGHGEQCADIRATGLDLVPIAVDDAGLCVDRLEFADAQAVLVTPAHQYPTGAVLAPGRRAALLEWAVRRDGWILEDDYDAEYRYDRAPVGALQGLAPDRVIYIGSASKMLAPSLRQGWLVLPEQLAADVWRAKLSADRGSPALEQLALAHFLEAGELDRHLRRTRAVYDRRRKALEGALREHLPGVALRGIAAGLHVLLVLPPDQDEAATVSAAAALGVRVYGAGVYFVDRTTAYPGLLIGYGSIEEGRIEVGVKLLALALQRASAAKTARPDNGREFGVRIRRAGRSSGGAD
jgi:GntR family transcriptional regulator / MocR family aminotransferase